MSNFNGAAFYTANHLRFSRPDVYEGTNVIANPDERADYYRKVTTAIQALDLRSGDDIGRFCDLAGVPD